MTAVSMHEQFTKWTLKLINDRFYYLRLILIEQDGGKSEPTNASKRQMGE